MDTIGWSSISDYNKIQDLYLGFAIVLVGFLLQYFSMMKSYGSVNDNDLEKTLFLIPFCLLPLISPSALSALCLVLVILYISFSRKTSGNILPDRHALSFFLIVVTVYLLVRSEAVFLSVLYLSASYYFFRDQSLSWILLFLSAVTVRFVIPSETVLSDPFHLSEWYTSFIGVNHQDVHPNIGILEQVPAAISKLIEVITFGHASFSLGGIRITFIIIALAYIVSKLANWNKPIAFVAAFFLGSDHRLNLLVVLCIIAFFISNGTKKLSALLLVSIMPAFCLLIPPNSAVFFILLIPFFYYELKTHSILTISLVIIAWVFQFFFLFSDFISYFQIYISFADVNLVAHGLPFTMSRGIDLVQKVILLVVFGIICYNLFEYLPNRKSETIFVKISLLLGILLFSYVVLSYSLTRIDPGPSRLFSITVFFAVAAAMLVPVPRHAVIGLLIVATLYYPQVFINVPRFQFPIVVNHKRDFLALDVARKSTLDRLEKYARGKGTNLILYSDPGLAPFGNFLLPPFTTPWITVGSEAQHRNIRYFEAHANLPIYLGNPNFLTFDGVDIRARSPLVFRYLAGKYKIENFEGLLFAFPEPSGGDSQLFSGFNLGKSPSYFAKWGGEGGKFVFVRDDEFCLRVRYREAEIVTSGNRFIVHLRCGSNYLPKVYILDERFSLEWR